MFHKPEHSRRSRRVVQEGVPVSSYCFSVISLSKKNVPHFIVQSELRYLRQVCRYHWSRQCSHTVPLTLADWIRWVNLCHLDCFQRGQAHSELVFQPSWWCLWSATETLSVESEWFLGVLRNGELGDLPIPKRFLDHRGTNRPQVIIYIYSNWCKKLYSSY